MTRAIDQFMDGLRTNSTTARLLWSAKSDQQKRFDDILCYQLTTDHGKHPQRIIIVQDFGVSGDRDLGYCTYYPSPINEILEEVMHLSQPRAGTE